MCSQTRKLEQLCQSFWQSVKEQKFKDKKIEGGVKASRVNVNKSLISHQSYLTFFFRFDLLSTCIQWKRVVETFTDNRTFRKHSPSWKRLKMPFSCIRVDGRKRHFQTRSRHGKAICRFYIFVCADEKWYFSKTLIHCVGSSPLLKSKPIEVDIGTDGPWIRCSSKRHVNKYILL